MKPIRFMKKTGHHDQELDYETIEILDMKVSKKIIYKRGEFNEITQELYEYCFLALADGELIFLEEGELGCLNLNYKLLQC